MTNLSTQAAVPDRAAKRKQISLQRIWRRLLSVVPGTHSFKRAVWRHMAASMKTWRAVIQEFSAEMLDLDLGLLDEASQRNIKRTLIRYQQRLSPYRSINAVLENSWAALVSLSFLFLIAGWVGSHPLARLLGYQGSGDAFLFSWSVLIVSSIVLWMLSTFQRLLSILRLRGAVETIATVALPVLMAFTVGFVAYEMLAAREAHAEEQGYFVWLVGLAISQIFMIWLYGFAAVFAMIQASLDRRNTALYPEAQFANCLMAARLKTREWNHPANRQEILTLLETAATCLEKHLRRQFISGDPGTDAWFGEMIQEIALGLRSLKKWVLLPWYDTRQHFTRQLLTILRDTARGDWNSLYREKPEALSRPRRTELFVRSVLRTVRTVLAAGGPLLILWSLQQLGIALSEDVVNYLTLGGIFWGAVSILLWVDPDLKNKLDILSSLKSLGQ